MTRIFAIAVITGTLVAGALTLGVGTAGTTPLSNAAAALKANAATSSLIEQIHGCNRACLRGPVPEWSGVVSWHRHVGKFCRPIECTP
jgi:hypothetical protein